MILKNNCHRCLTTLSVEIDDDAPEEAFRKAEEELIYKASNHCVAIHPVTGDKFYTR